MWDCRALKQKIDNCVANLESFRDSHSLATPHYSAMERFKGNTQTNKLFSCPCGSFSSFVSISILPSDAEDDCDIDIIMASPQPQRCGGEKGDKENPVVCIYSGCILILKCLKAPPAKCHRMSYVTTT